MLSGLAVTVVAAVTAANVDQMRLMHYADSAAVKSALDDGSLDLVVGAGPLDPQDVQGYQSDANFHVDMTQPIQNRLVIMNTNSTPTNDIQLRKAIIAAIDKVTIINNEMAGLAAPVDQLFPIDAPYCNLQLRPRLDYDLEKARLLNCPGGVCRQYTLDFLVLAGDAVSLAIEDDIRANLAVINITVNTRVLAKDALNAEMVAGNFHLVFSETWGAPYDPHAYAKSWATPDEAMFPALAGLPSPRNKSVLDIEIADVLVTENVTARQQKWRSILTYLHEQAVALPFSGKRIPAVYNNRLSGYVSGQQQFDYPIHTLSVDSGSTTITVAPGAQSGLFSGVGRMDPHTYRPNEFFANNWIYEGLVEYGPDGAILPSLATAWNITTAGSGLSFTFYLRRGVRFHDGAAWNCTVAKLNIDNVLAGPLTTADWHGWYGLPGQINSVMCTDAYTLVLTTREQYYPLLQELTFIRPLRFISPNAFAGGITSDPFTQNSCHVGWGNITDPSMPGVVVQCAGVNGSTAGTGRWIYNGTILNGAGALTEVRFRRNANHWGASASTSTAYPLTYESCGVNHTLSRKPTRAITMNQGVTEFMLAMGLGSSLVGTAYLDDSIWPQYAAEYAQIPVLSTTYPNETTIMAATPDFILGSYRSAFREYTCTTTRCRGIFSSATVGPCAGPGSDFFPTGSNATTSYSTCRPQLHAAGVGTWLEPTSCEDSSLQPQGGATEETVYAAIRQIGDIFDVRSVAEALIADVRNDFSIAAQAVEQLGTPLTAVWVDCVDCSCGPEGLFVGAGTGAPNLIMSSAGLTNVFTSTVGSWACVNITDLIAADPDVFVIVDAAWDTALSKIEFIHNHTGLCGARAVTTANYVTIPFSASTLGPRNGAAALDMSSAALHLTQGGSAINFNSGVSFFPAGYLENRTAGLRCPVTNASSADVGAGAGGSGSSGGDGDGDDDRLVIGIAVACVVAILILIALAFVIHRERGGAPIFTPIENPEFIGNPVPTKTTQL